MFKRMFLLASLLACALASALTLHTAEAQRRGAPPAPGDPDAAAQAKLDAVRARLREQVSLSRGVIQDRLQPGDLVAQKHQLTGRTVYEAKFVDKETGEVFGAAVGEDGEAMDAAAAAGAEAKAKAARYGKIDPRLAAIMNGGLTETDAAAFASGGWGGAIPVSIWLNVPETTPRRLSSTTSSFAAQEAVSAHLATLEQSMTANRAGVVNAISKLGAQARVPKYAPAVFAHLTPKQISLLSRRADVSTIYYGAEQYGTFSDKATTTLRTWPVWQASNFGNLGLGMVRPVVHEAAGISDTNPFLNNGTHAVLFWCTPGQLLCPAGKNNTGGNIHATWVAGTIGSTHPLVRGVAPNSQVLLSANAQNFSDAQLVDAFEWARDNGGDPTNMSWGTVCGAGQQVFMSRYIDWATRNLGSTIVISSGNTSGCSTAVDPSADLYVSAPGLAWTAITVGSYRDNNNGFWAGDAMSTFSRFVNPVFAPGMEKPEVVAMGEDVRTTDNQGGDHLSPSGVNGTSFSSPQVAGQVALMLSRQPAQNQWPETNKAAVLASAFHDVVAGTARDGVGSVMMNISDDTYRLGRFANDFAPNPAAFPRNYTINLAAGQVVRVAIAWDAISNGSTADILGADIDLHVSAPGGAVIASSVSVQNAWELVQFTAPVTGAYTVRATHFSSVVGWPGTFLGMAYSVRSLPDFCTNVATGPIPATTTVTTANGPTWFDSYAGWAFNQSGREYIRRIVVAPGGPNDIVVTDTNSNIDLHIIQIPICAADPIVPSVKANGVNSASFLNAPAGTYYVVADGFNGTVGTTGINIKLLP